VVRRPIDVLGVSTGGSAALQLTADHPGVVRRLVLVSSACRLGPRARHTQRELARYLAEGDLRRGSVAMNTILGTGPASDWIWKGLEWLTGPRMFAGGAPTCAPPSRRRTFDSQGQAVQPHPVSVAGWQQIYPSGLYDTLTRNRRA
jgi:pimeloyl-ACP methyl ester carboxylesterase